MEKVYDIYIDGELERLLSDISASESDKEYLEKIKNGAKVEFVECGNENA